MPRIRHLFLKGALGVLHSVGAQRWMSPLARGRGAIFMLHRVRPWGGESFAPNRLLEVTPEFLDETIGQVASAGFDLVSFDEARRRIAGPDDGRAFAVFTLDDGYRDNITFAAPVFRKHRCPFTVYCVTDFLDGDGLLWWLVVEEAIRRLPRISVDFGHGMETIDTSEDHSKAVAFTVLHAYLRSSGDSVLRETVMQIAASADLDPARLCRDACMNWDEMLALSSDPLVTIGTHTKSHPILAKLDVSEASREMLVGRRLLEERLGRKVEHFAYPIGDRPAAGPREFELARGAGFATAVTTRSGQVFADHANHFEALPRVPLNGHFQSRRYVELFLSGVPFALAQRFRRVNAA